MPPVPHDPAAEAQDHAALIAALDAGDLAGPDLARAERLLAGCAGCGSLRDDLAAIRVAMIALPSPARRRDYRLTEEDAARLRPSGWRRVAGWLAAPRSSVRPLATGLATLGVVGLLLTAGLPGFGGGVAVLHPAGETVDGAAPEGAPLDVRVTERATEEPAVAPAPGLAGEPSPDAVSTQDLADPGRGGDGEAYAGGGKSGADEATGDAAARQSEPGPSVPLALSLALLTAGLGLFLARAISLRRA